jgi:hypothetical protein
MKLATHLHLVLRLRMSRAILLLLLCVFKAWIWKTLHFSLCCIHNEIYVAYSTSLALYDTLKNVWTVIFCSILFYYIILFHSNCNQSNCFCWTQPTGCTDCMIIIFTSRNYIGVVNVKIILKWTIIVSGMFWCLNHLYHI